MRNLLLCDDSSIIWRSFCRGGTQCLAFQVQGYALAGSWKHCLEHGWRPPPYDGQQPSPYLSGSARTCRDLILDSLESPTSYAFPYHPISLYLDAYVNRNKVMLCQRMPHRKHPHTPLCTQLRLISFLYQRTDKRVLTWEQPTDRLLQVLELGLSGNKHPMSEIPGIVTCLSLGHWHSTTVWVLSWQSKHEGLVLASSSLY